MPPKDTSNDSEEEEEEEEEDDESLELSGSNSVSSSSQKQELVEVDAFSGGLPSMDSSLQIWANLPHPQYCIMSNHSADTPNVQHTHKTIVSGRESEPGPIERKSTLSKSVKSKVRECYGHTA